MAESAAKIKTRRKLDEENFELWRYTYKKDGDWRDMVCRGAREADSVNPEEYYGNAYDGAKGAYGKDANRSEQKLPEATQKDLGLMNFVSKLDDPKEFFERVVAAVSSLKNLDLTVRDWNIFGNKYVTGRAVEYLMAFYAVGEETRLDMKRMAGDGFAMADFFSEVKNQLKKENLIIAKEEESVDFAYDEDSDDDSGDDENLDRGYLQLKYDPSIVRAWIQKIQNRHVEDQIHMLGLMAYNASNKQNLEIIVNKGGQNLKAMFINKFENSNIAALARFTSELAKHVTGHPDCAKHGYDEVFLVAALDTVKYWCPNKSGSSFSEKNRQQSTKFEVTESRETVMNLIQVIYNLGETMKIYPKKTIVEKAKARLEKKKYNRSPKDDILKFLNAQADTTPVSYFRHILKQF